MTDIKPKKKAVSWWPFLTFLAAGLGGVMWLVLLNFTTDGDGNLISTKLRDILTILVASSLVLGGVGQSMRSAAHGARASAGRRIDGSGKVIGVFAWALGLVASMAFAYEGTNVSNVVLGVAIVSWLLVIAGCIFYYVWAWCIRN
ncbi:hypothetical protein [Brevibacterium aurantiacum]|uniref:Uncharacterized protein n=1 Tax=Brevibacterium aurantiacum TaxID=273384 RepID=A0A2A3YV86_BREAU|nr:hypothetical protein [Brevibacterium aurantiacum]PCC43171.1 hypothetical protein CIK65_07680 [Brevibacterium aurantiacum]